MKKFLALVLSLVMVLSLCGNALAAYTQSEIEAMGNYINGTYYTNNEIAHDQVSRTVAEESYVLLENNGVLPIAKSGKIALFGNGATGTMKGGIGSGIVNMRERDWIDTAFEDAGYEITTPQAYRDAVGRGSVATGFLGDREAVDVALTDEWIEEALASDTAIYVVARTAGEGSDRQLNSGNGAWYLTDVERANIEKIAANFENVIIGLNTYITDVSWLKEIDNIDAVLHIGYGGQRTGATVLNVLNGTVTPSGKTNATWAWDLDDYASSQAGFSWMDGNTTTEYYEDGIYVGYRYFDTFGLVDEVAYPIGYGLSYTDFDIDVDNVEIDEEEVAVTVTVANVGNTYSGKEVVQVYFSAPDGELEKPYQELAAFAKTDELAPGEKQTMTITYPTADMSSYSEERAAYILEAGDYYIRVGNSSRNTHIAAAATLAETVVTEQLVNQFELEDGAVLDEISKEGVDPITYEGEAEEMAAAKAAATVLDVDALEALTVDNSEYLKELDTETATTYLFAEDYENYVPSENITVKQANVAGILENRPDQVGDSILDLNTSARYVRVNMSNPATQFGFSIIELALYNDGENIALNETTTAESYDGDSSPDLATDGKTMTSWASDWGTGTTTASWIMVDLGEVRELDGMSIIFNSQNYPGNVDVQVSNNGVDFENVAVSTVPDTGMIVDGGGSVSGYVTSTYSETKALVEALPEGLTEDTVKLTDVLSGDITLEQFVASLSVDEMARLAHATGQGSTEMGYIYDEEGNVISLTHAMMNNMARSTAAYYATRHIPALGFTDGPAGIRCDNETRYTSCPQIFGPGDQGGAHYWSTDGGYTIVPEGTEGAEQYSVYPTAFPGTTNISSTWNTDMMYIFGEAVGVEMREYNVNAWLAPGINIVRNPMCGRNFEYASEDPYLSGMTAAYITAGVQSNDGVGVCLKHYWGNNQENNRGSENNVVSERAAREIYFTGYEICVKLAQPMYIMTSYNENNGWSGANDYDACTDLARGEWGFNGAIMTDWNGGQSSPHISMHAGNDFICPGKAVTTITDYIGKNEPIFEEDGYVTVTETSNGCWGTTLTEEWGNFVVDPEGGEEAIAPVENYDALGEEVLEAIEAGEAKYCSTADGNYVTWFGYYNEICLGDLQKSAKNIANVMLYSQDMEILCEDLGIEYPEEYHNFSEAMNAPLAHDWTNIEKGEISNVALVIDTVEADAAAADTVEVPVTYTGDADITSVRFKVASELEIADIVVADGYEMENNNGYVVIYAADGSVIDGVVATLIIDISNWPANGTYAIDGEVVDASDADAENTIVKAVDGAVVIANDYYAGDATLDGMVSNADIIAIARYLVDLVEFNAEQIAAADVDVDGEVDNADLIKIARGILDGRRIDEAIGNYTVVVEGYDWGAASTKVILDLDRNIAADSVEADDFSVLNTMQGCRGTSTSTRRVTDAYVSDAEGNEVEENSNYVALELYVSPNEGGAFYYNMMGSGHNVWPDPYYFTIDIATADGIKYNGTVVDTLALDVDPAAIVCPLADDFVQTEFTAEDGTVLNYGAWSPEADNEKNPLIIWLHGAGEGGTDNDIVTMGNKVVNLVTDEIQQYFTTEEISGAYVLTPQSPTMWMDMGDGQYTNNGSSIYTESLMELIESYVAGNPDIDTDRIYIGGCSNGGYMTMNMIMTYPEYFAAAYPICEAYTDSWITDEQIEAIKDIPIWFTHAANDTTVRPATHTVATYNRLVAAGAENVHFSYFDDVHDTTGNYTQADGTPYQYQGHWSWVYTLNNECVEEDGTTIMEWLAAQSK